MSEFTEDMRAIDEWGKATGEAILKGLPWPELILPSNHKECGHQEQQNPMHEQPQADLQAASILILRRFTSFSNSRILSSEVAMWLLPNREYTQSYLKSRSNRDSGSWHTDTATEALGSGLRNASQERR